MFIIISYLKGTYENINIVSDKDGNPVVLGSYHTAEKEAKDACAWDYKIVEI